MANFGSSMSTNGQDNKISIRTPSFIVARCCWVTVVLIEKFLSILFELFLLKKTFGWRMQSCLNGLNCFRTKDDEDADQDGHRDPNDAKDT